MKRDADAITKQDMANFQETRKELEVDLLDEVLGSRKLAWRVAGCLGGLAALSMGVMALVMYRYSQPVPAHMLVMNTDGSVKEVSLLTPQSSYGEVSDTYWTAKFVEHFEGYDFNLAQGDYNAVGLMAGPVVAEQYQERYKWGTEDALDRRWGDSRAVRVKISSVILDRDNGIATVRFSTTEKHRSRSLAEKPQHWIATLAYTYDNMLLKADERYINPLGFRVISYRVNPETNP